MGDAHREDDRRRLNAFLGRPCCSATDIGSRGEAGSLAALPQDLEKPVEAVQTAGHPVMLDGQCCRIAAPSIPHAPELSHPPLGSIRK